MFNTFVLFKTVKHPEFNKRIGALLLIVILLTFSGIRLFHHHSDYQSPVYHLHTYVIQEICPVCHFEFNTFTENEVHVYQHFSDLTRFDQTNPVFTISEYEGFFNLSLRAPPINDRLS
jgi:hypothetical protein